MPGGRPPKPTALHLLEGTWRPSRHRDRIDAPVPGTPATAPDEISVEEQEQRRIELVQMLARLAGGGIPDPRQRGLNRVAPKPAVSADFPGVVRRVTDRKR